MKKISIILASLLTALLLASCTPVNSFDLSTEEGMAELMAYSYGTPMVVTAADADGKVSGTFTAKGKDKLPATITLKAAEAVEGGKTLSITDGSNVIYSAALTDELAVGKTVDLEISTGTYSGTEKKISDTLVIEATNGGMELSFEVEIQ